MNVTFLNAFRSFFESYSIHEGCRVSVTNARRTQRKKTNPWANPAKWSKSSFHFSAEYGYGCNSAENRRLCCFQEGLPHLQRGLSGCVSEFGSTGFNIEGGRRAACNLTEGIEVLHAHAIERKIRRLRLSGGYLILRQVECKGMDGDSKRWIPFM
jgi:hypothetical protein